ncbi:MAG: EamA/RhaT family transporter [Hyphomicrobiales bacterium]|nr:MAG: EamA/RhaT family transporter [Hyphomicrobiales bacterium]
MHGPDRPVLGIVLMFGFCILAPLGDAIAKLLGGSVSLGQLLLVRFAVQAALLLPIALWSGHLLRLPPRILWLTLLRTVLHIAGIGAMFSALRFLPLADAVAIAFVMPFILLLLGRYVLGEVVGPRRLIACLVGFAGTLLVIQPSFETAGAAALLPLIVAVDFALFMLVTRQIARAANPISLQAVSGLMAVAILGLLHVAAAPWQPPIMHLALPALRDGLLLAALGLIGVTAHLLMTWSLRHAPAATLAPMQYLEIPFATLIGWLIFQDLPGGLAAIGILIIALSGLFVVLRERAAAQTVPPET